MSDTCPSCSENEHIACYDCGLFAAVCECGSSHRFCYLCQKDFIVQLPGFDWDKTKTDQVIEEIEDSITKDTAPPPKKCERHWFEPVDLGGVTIHCSTLNNTRDRGGIEVPTPDFGLYADYKWEPTWDSVIIDWPDYSIPRHLPSGTHMIAYGYHMAVAGAKVEIGCIGGHGRTGTILACLKVYHEKGKADPDEVIKWVKDNYCSHAIETANQKWFVSYFSNYWFKTPLEPLEQKTSKTTTNTTSSSTVSSGQWTPGNLCKVEEHYAMIMRGHPTCHAKNPCKWWGADVKGFPDEDTEAPVIKRAMALAKNYPLRYLGIRLPDDEQDTHSKEMHAVMFEKGHRVCAILKTDCGYWEEDLAKFKSGDFSEVDRNEAVLWLDKLSNIPKVSNDPTEPLA